MESVGQILRSSRVAQGRTLEQVNSSTRISLGNLQAIEADESSHFGSAFFYKSFVRQFAQDLRLDFCLLEPSLHVAAETFAPPLMPGQAESAAPKIAALRPPRRHRYRGLLSFASLVAVLIACSGVYAKWQSSRISVQGLWSSAAIALKPLPGERFRHAPSAPVTQPAPNAFTVEVAATEPTWVSLVSDGKSSFSGLLETAQTKTIEGHENARVRTGNAGGVNVIFNGKLLGALGPRGQVRTAIFTRDRYEVLETPQHVAAASFSLTAGPILLPAHLQLPLF